MKINISLSALLFVACAVCVFATQNNGKSNQNTSESAACQDALNMGINGKKVELNININEGESQCKCKPQLQAWRKVDPSMVTNSYTKGMTVTLVSDHTGGLIINANVVDNGCGGGRPGSKLVVHIKGEWTQIMYTQVFKKSASCWGIFGNTYHHQHEIQNAGLEVFNPSFGDIIFGQKKMFSSADDIFDGRSTRCDNLGDNFWHANNGQGERQATVILRRKKSAKKAGIQTGTSCGTPQYTIKDIYVLM